MRYVLRLSGCIVLLATFLGIAYSERDDDSSPCSTGRGSDAGLITDTGTRRDTGTGEDATACTDIGPSGPANLIHAGANGSQAADVAQAFAAIFAAQSPPIDPGPSYTIENLECDYFAPQRLFPSGGNGCDFSPPSGSVATTDIVVQPPSDLAANLMNALGAAGAYQCLDSTAHMTSQILEHVQVSPTSVQFDDVSIFDAPPSAKVVVAGPPAQSVITAFAGAGINDCNPWRKVMIVCNALNGQPGCGYYWLRVHTFGSSELRFACGPNEGVTPGGVLGPEASQAMWQAILGAAQAAGYQPLNGTLAQTTLAKASYFSWDGAQLAFTLFTDDAVPPGGTPPPPPQ